MSTVVSGLNVGVYLEHDSTSPVEIAWNFIRGNGLTEVRCAQLDELEDGSDLQLGLGAYAYFANRPTYKNAVQLRNQSEHPLPTLLPKFLQLIRNGMIPSSLGCRKCAAYGLHSIVFSIPWIHRCPVHGTRLSLVSPPSPRSPEDCQLAPRLAYARQLDRYSAMALSALDYALENADVFVPMSRVSTPLRNWHFYTLWRCAPFPDGGRGSRALVTPPFEIQALEVRKPVASRGVGRRNGERLQVAFRRACRRWGLKEGCQTSGLEDSIWRKPLFRPLSIDQSKVEDEDDLEALCKRFGIALESCIFGRIHEQQLAQKQTLIRVDHRIGKGLHSSQFSDHDLEALLHFSVSQAILNFNLHNSTTLNFRRRTYDSAYIDVCTKYRLTAIKLIHPTPIVLLPKLSEENVLEIIDDPFAEWNEAPKYGRFGRFG